MASTVDTAQDSTYDSPMKEASETPIAMTEASVAVGEDRREPARPADSRRAAPAQSPPQFPIWTPPDSPYKDEPQFDRRSDSKSTCSMTFSAAPAYPADDLDRGVAGWSPGSPGSDRRSDFEQNLGMGGWRRRNLELELKQTRAQVLEATTRERDLERRLQVAERRNARLQAVLQIYEQDTDQRRRRSRWFECWRPRRCW